jgi:hypothetical protein
MGTPDVPCEVMRIPAADRLKARRKNPPRPTAGAASRRRSQPPAQRADGREMRGKRPIHGCHAGDFRGTMDSGGAKLVTEEDLRMELARLKQENERLKGQRARGISLKVSEKGALSVYGLGRFPVTLYKEQWRKLLEASEEIQAFLAENDEKLKTKS